MTKMMLSIVVLVAMAGCRVECEDSDGGCDVYDETDGDYDAELEGDSEAWDGGPCTYACDGVRCSDRGACDMDLDTCTPYCFCFIGWHAQGLECVPD